MQIPSLFHTSAFVFRTSIKPILKRSPVNSEILPLARFHYSSVCRSSLKRPNNKTDIESPCREQIFTNSAASLCCRSSLGISGVGSLVNREDSISADESTTVCCVLFFSFLFLLPGEKRRSTEVQACPRLSKAQILPEDEAQALSSTTFEERWHRTVSCPIRLLVKR